jgi:putative PIG3 family NAD(P)H quinone oxidoreductase
MKAILHDEKKPDSLLAWSDVPSPALGPGEVIIQVAYAGVNRADLLQRIGRYPPPPGASPILGLEVSGRIKSMSPEVTGWRLGDRVCSLLSGGGYATEVVAPASLLMRVPDDWSLKDAASVPETFFTAYLNLFLEAGLRPGESVLIHGGASGVGVAAIQLAREAGCRVFTTVGTPEKQERTVALGAELAINYKSTDFLDALQEKTNGDGVDVILDIVGGTYLERNLRLLKSRGRMVVISLLGGTKCEIDLARLMKSRITIIGSVLRSRSLREKEDIRKRFLTEAWSLLLAGRIVPVIDSTYPVEDVEAAHAKMKANANIGKIVLLVNPTVEVGFR